MSILYFDAAFIGGSPVAPRQEARTRESRLPLIRGDSTDWDLLWIAPSVAEGQGYLSQKHLPHKVSLTDNL